jgi:hypothetical protein
VVLAGGRATVIAGTMFGATSPVIFPHPIIYAELFLDAGASVDLAEAWGERGVHSVAIGSSGFPWHPKR